MDDARIWVMPIKEIAGSRIAVDCLGQGEPTLIFVHGGGCDRHDWRAQRRALSARFRIVTADMPSHGESERAPTASIESIGRAVAGLKMHYAQGGVVLVGHSMGCRFVLEAFRQSRADVVGIVFVDGSHFSDETAVETTRLKIQEMGEPLFLERTFGQMFLPTSDQALRRQVLARARGWNSQFILSMIGWDAREAARVLVTVDVPVLVLQSSYLDETFTRHSLTPNMTTPWMKLVTNLVRRSTLRTLPGIGHFPHIEAPEVVNKHIENFVDSLDSLDSLDGL